MTDQIFIDISDVSKTFGNTHALSKVNFKSSGGEIHAILGENGAGKSTLVNVISGVVKPDSGIVKILGQEISVFNPYNMLKRKVATVFQNLSLIPHLTVSENLFLNHTGYKTKYNKEYEVVCDLFEQYNIKDIDPFAIVEDLSLNQKQIIEIVKALFLRPKILILDEPTSALNPPEVEWLFNIVKKLKKEDVCILYISHRIAEVRKICDMISVLRNGENVGTFPTKQVSNSQIIDKMLGHHLDQKHGHEERQISNQIILQVENANYPPDLKNTDLVVHEGEVLGVAGLAGQGQIDIFRILFGIQQCPLCKIKTKGQKMQIKSPIDAIKAGIVFLPTERNHDTMFYGLPTSQNMSISILDLVSKFGWLDQTQEGEKVNSIGKSLNINLDQIRNRISSLSGGNQQKALLGKWLLTDARIFLLYDPTRGVDIGTKFEIIKLVKQMAKNGKTVIYYSTDIDELVDLSDRVLVFYQGQICDTFTKDDIKSEKILQAVTGIK